MMRLGNYKTSKICAVCKYWNDPANSVIKFKNGNVGFIEFEDTAIKKCLKNGLDRQAWVSCGDFSCKF